MIVQKTKSDLIMNILGKIAPGHIPFVGKNNTLTEVKSKLRIEQDIVAINDPINKSGAAINCVDEIIIPIL